MAKDLVWHADDMLRFSAMPFRYRSGEEIRTGDRILYNSEPGTIDFVATPQDSRYTWYVEQYGGGCMILVAPFGSRFVSNPHEDEDLDLVSRDVSAPE